MVEQEKPRGLPLYNLTYVTAVVGFYATVLHAGLGDGLTGLALLFFGLPIFTAAIGGFAALLGFVRKRLDPAFGWDAHLGVALGVPMACAALAFAGILLFGKGGC